MSNPDPETPVVVEVHSGGDPVDLSGNGIVISMNDLLTHKEYMFGVDQRNKALFNNINYALLKQNLITWSSAGFPDSTCIYSFSVEMPNENMCSDGIVRDCWDYIPFVLGMTIGHFIAGIQLRLSGIRLTYSVGTGPVVLNVHATR